MAVISAVLAQQIVERTMKIIPFNVNVMDAHGVIIASGDPVRLGTLHAGAQLALSRHGAIEVDTATLPHMPGAQAGINLPLSVRGEICGVVGITGEPDVVRQFGELVCLTAEMILEQAQLTGELQREKGYREEFIYQLVRQTGVAPAAMEAWAVRLGLDLQQPRTVLVLQLADEGVRPDLALAELQRAQSALAARWPALLTAVITPREMAMLDRFEPTQPGGEATQARRRLAAFGEVAGQALNMPWLLAMGVALPGLEGAASSYESARRAARVGRQRQPERQLFSYYELSLPVLLSGLDVGWQAAQLRQPLQRLREFDRKSGTLVKTLAAWFAHNSQPVATAKALHIHRNTLDYRLQKIGELTGLDLGATDDRLLLYVALQMAA
jgi:carbohydrate diacid regulator